MATLNGFRKRLFFWAFFVLHHVCHLAAVLSLPLTPGLQSSLHTQTRGECQIEVIVSKCRFWFSPSAFVVSRVTKFDDDMVVASKEFEGRWVGAFF